ncbi:MAG: homocysteine S-methyltransferase family protein [Chloroflexi bacterium]|nr:homocysteine S-methyltransferase family protein [Chloroflexota bacterium]
MLDGAMGTEIQARGSAGSQVGWGGPTSMEEPYLIRGIHADYVSAGADVINTAIGNAPHPSIERRV